MYKMFLNPKIIIGAKSADSAPKSVYLYFIIILKIWNDRDINTRNNSRSDDPGDICPQGIPQNKRVRIILTNQLLSYLCCSWHTTDSCNADHRIIISFLNEVHDVSSHNATDTRKQQCHYAQYQQFQNLRIEQ